MFLKIRPHGNRSPRWKADKENRAGSSSEQRGLLKKHREQKRIYFLEEDTGLTALEQANIHPVEHGRSQVPSTSPSILRGSRPRCTGAHTPPTHMRHTCTLGHTRAHTQQILILPRPAGLRCPRIYKPTARGAVKLLVPDHT